MSAIYRGRRYAVASADSDTVTLDSANPPGTRIRVSLDDRELLFKPDEDDLQLAEAFERGEIEAFEYPDGHTYPPNREISTTARTPSGTRQGPHVAVTDVQILTVRLGAMGPFDGVQKTGQRAGSKGSMPIS